MSDLKKYIDRRKQADQEFSSEFDEGYKAFKIGAILKQAREARRAYTGTNSDKITHTKIRYFKNRKSC